MASDLIFLTGGTGFLGRHLVSLLSSQHYRVRLLVRDTSDVSWSPKQNIDLCYGDVTDKNSILTGREPFYPLSLRHYAFNDWDMSSEMVKNELDFEPTPLEEGLRTTVDWIKRMEKKRKGLHG